MTCPGIVLFSQRAARGVGQKINISSVAQQLNLYNEGKIGITAVAVKHLMAAQEYLLVLFLEQKKNRRGDRRERRKREKGRERE